MSIEDLIIRLHTEEDNRGSKKKRAHNLNKVKVVEHDQVSKFKKAYNKGKSTKLRPKGGVSKKLKFQGKCFNCGMQGYKFEDCRLPKRNKPKEANVVDDISKDVSNIGFTVVIFEVNLM